MMLRFTAAAVFGLALVATPGASQTVAEQLQKALYAQQTSGDVDAAIQIYRQVLASSPADRRYVAVAQFRLAQALLQKGELAEAAREFQALANYPEYKDAIAALAGRVRGVHDSVISRGTYNVGGGNGGQYANRASGVVLRVPPGWTIVDGESSDGGDIAALMDPDTKCSVAVWMKAEQHSAGELTDLLRHDLEVKGQMRSDLEGWKITQTGGPESGGSVGPAGHQRLRAIAEFTINGNRWTEMLTWIRSAKSHVLFFARFPASQMNTYQRRFEEVINTTVVP